MTIHKTDRSRLSSEILHEGVYNQELSWQAKGLLWFLLTSPSWRESYDARERDPDLFDSALQELQEKGYVFVRDGVPIENELEVFESKRDAREWFVDASESVHESIAPLANREGSGEDSTSTGGLL